MIRNLLIFIIICFIGGLLIYKNYYPLNTEKEPIIIEEKRDSIIVMDSIIYVRDCNCEKLNKLNKNLSESNKQQNSYISTLQKENDSIKNTYLELKELYIGILINKLNDTTDNTR